MKITDVAEQLGVSKQRVHALVKSGKLKSTICECGNPVVSPPSVDLYLKCKLREQELSNKILEARAKIWGVVK